MRSNHKLWEICEEIYQKMYKEADPPLDFRRAVKEGITAKQDWFQDHYLPTKRQQEIIDEIEKKHRCSTYEKRQIEMEVWLGSSPTAIKKERQ